MSKTMLGQTDLMCLFMRCHVVCSIDSDVNVPVGSEPVQVGAEGDHFDSD